MGISDFSGIINFINKMSLMKGLFGFIGRTLIGIGLTLFILSFFMNYAIGDIDILEDTLKDTLIKDIEDMEGYDGLKSFCDNNPSDDSCDIINNPDQVIEEGGFNQFIGNITTYGIYIPLFLWGSILLFIIGFGFIYLAKKSFILALYKVSFSSTITTALAIFYYKYFPLLFDKILSGMDFGGKIPMEVLDIVSNIIHNWLYLPLQKTYVLAIWITAVFLVITVVLFFVKKKGLYKPTKG